MKTTLDTQKVKESGLTLIEIVLAMIILTVGILSIFSVIIPSMYLEQVSREFDIAKAAAANKLEEIRASDFDTAYTTYNNNYFQVRELSTPSGITNTGLVSISNANPDLLDITVTITWASQIRANANKSLSMKTMFAKTSE
jgi:Tfp pilus assembly protein PilV